MFLNRIFCLIGNSLPPILNKVFYKLAGVNFNFSKVWIGNKCYFDSVFPQNIIIQDNVCISHGVTIVTHFDPSEAIPKHAINKYKKKVILQNGVFIGPNSIIMPGLTIKKNSFIKAGTVVTRDIMQNSIVFGNPQVQKKLTVKIINEINRKNKKYTFL